MKGVRLLVWESRFIPWILMMAKSSFRGAKLFLSVALQTEVWRNAS